MKIKFLVQSLILLVFFSNFSIFAQTSKDTRMFSGAVVTQQFELVPNVSIEVQTSDGKLQAVTDAEGNFSLQVPYEPFSVKFYGKNINSVTRIFSLTDTVLSLQIKISYILTPVIQRL